MRFKKWFQEHRVLSALLAVAAVLFNWLPQWIASVWSLFSSEPLYQWLLRQGFPHFAFSVQFITWPVTICLLVIIAWALLAGRATRAPLATALDSGLVRATSPHSLTAEIIPHEGAPVLMRLVNKDPAHVARIHSARLIGVTRAGREELLQSPLISSERQGWTKLPAVMQPTSRIEIAFAGMCDALLPHEYVGYFAEVELEDETTIRTKQRISFTNALAEEPASSSEGQQALDTECGPNVAGSSPYNEWGSGKVRFFRLAVESNLTQPIKNCRAQLIKIEHDGKQKWGNDNAILTFAPGEDDDATSKTLHPKKTEYVDVIAVTYSGELFPGTKPPRQWLFLPRLPEIFGTHGDYILTVVITGDSLVPHVDRLRFDWTGNYETSSLEKIADGTKSEAQPPEAAQSDADEDALSDQASRILSLFADSGARHLIPGSGGNTLQFDTSGKGIRVGDPRFLNDDLADLVSRGFLMQEVHGKWRFFEITRRGQGFAEQWKKSQQSIDHGFNK